MADYTIVYPKPGVTIHLPGGSIGFAGGSVPMQAEHAAALSAHVMTEAERTAAARPAPAAPAAATAALAASDRQS